VTCDLGAPAIALGLVVNVRDGADTVINDSTIGLLGAGGAGADLLIGSDTAVDQIRGEGGADEVSGRGGDDTVSGGAGNDRLFGGPGDDLLDGAAGADFFYGDDGDDLLRGGDGIDDMIGGTGADVHDGGPGRDQASYSERSVGIVADLDDARGDDGVAGEGDSLLRIEDIVGTTENDVLIGNNSDNSLFGSSGGDFIRGLGGNDYLEGGVTEFDGTDSLDGGDDRGNPGDICRYTPNSGSITVNCEAFLEG
jgi:Ca2+-binding RTX toxin-like protein